MNELNLVTALLIGAATLSACAASTQVPKTATTGATTMDRPTDSFRHEHAELKEHLAHLNDAIGKLPTATPADQKEMMRHVVGFMREHIKPHAEWEERVLYPAVDKRAASGPNPFTATMRYEHGVVGRWTDELAAIAARDPAPVVEFARRADNLLGLIWAHFEEEEEVLLPILDRTMSKEDFEREIGSKHHGG